MTDEHLCLRESSSCYYFNVNSASGYCLVIQSAIRVTFKYSRLGVGNCFSITAIYFSLFMSRKPAIMTFYKLERHEKRKNSSLKLWFIYSTFFLQQVLFTLIDLRLKHSHLLHQAKTPCHWESVFTFLGLEHNNASVREYFFVAGPQCKPWPACQV